MNTNEVMVSLLHYHEKIVTRVIFLGQNHFSEESGVEIRPASWGPSDVTASWAFRLRAHLLRPHLPCTGSSEAWL